jgi:hypothetical protein
MTRFSHKVVKGNISVDIYDEVLRISCFVRESTEVAYFIGEGVDTYRVILLGSILFTFCFM